MVNTVVENLAPACLFVFLWYFCVKVGNMFDCGICEIKRLSLELVYAAQQ